jgi:DNA repair exonuclease SbcCD ATPase subunit
MQERFEELLRLLDENPEFLEALQDRIVDEKAILRALEKRAEVREAIRRQILHDEFLQLPELVRQLIEAQQHNEAQLQEHNRLIRQLIESQQRHEAILQEHSRLLQQLIESQQRHEAILQEHSRLLQQLIESQQRHEAILQEHSRLLQQLIEAQQRHEAILQEHSRLLQQLIEAQQRHEAILQEHSRLLQQLIEAQQRHEAILQEHTRQLQEHSRLLQQLIESQQRHEAILQEHARQLQELTAQVRRVVEVQEQLARDIHEIKKWQSDLDGRLRGDELEKDVRRRARSIFAGGRGGHTDSPPVRRQLKRWLRTLNGDDAILESEADPQAADLIWIKGDKVIVVEVSVKVDRNDVNRAYERANTLRRAGVDAVPVVIGEEWTSDTVKDLAQSLTVEWYVQKKLSEGFIALRRISDDGEDDE